MSRSTSTAKNHLVHQVQAGAIIAEIMRGATSDGHPYLYYQISRVWLTQNGQRRQTSTRFYERNEKDHKRAVELASTWIRKHPQAADPDWNPTPAPT